MQSAISTISNVSDIDDPPVLQVRYRSLEALQRDYEENLIKGRAFVEGHFSAEERSRVRLMFVRPECDSSFECWGEVMWINRDGAAPGTGVKLARLTQAERRALHRFASSTPRPSERPIPLQSRALPEVDTAAREVVARSGKLSERVALERHFGSAVWAELLQNPELTAAEVARIAQHATLPRPLLEVVVSNDVWLTRPEVRHALLANPAVDGAALERVMQALPVAECARVARSRAFRQKVRLAAKERLK
ncbi:MAG TPA: hypothetical protein VFU02_16480 [Polyangiaceae bacterium]|nr:hypothetical protein [Polyangiaceae bacterium]